MTPSLSDRKYVAGKSVYVRFHFLLSSLYIMNNNTTPKTSGENASYIWRWGERVNECRVCRRREALNVYRPSE